MPPSWPRKLKMVKYSAKEVQYRAPLLAETLNLCNYTT